MKLPLSDNLSRREFVRRAALTASAGLLAGRLPSLRSEPSADFRPIFDGETLAGWRAVPRLAPPAALLRDETIPTDELNDRVIKWFVDHGHQNVVDHVGKWEVVDHAIVGGRNPADSNLGCYLQSEAKYGDFELELDAHPDFPADTGILIRDHACANIGFQILLDHRKNGGIAGVYGNSLGAWIAAPFYLTGDEAPGYKVANLRQGTKPDTGAHPVPMAFAASFADFVKVWNLNDWNTFRILCVGEVPTITTWVNGLKICELDTSAVQAPGDSPDLVRRLLGREGHIAFEVHDAGKMGHDRWAEGAVCRWRDLRLKEV